MDEYSQIYPIQEIQKLTIQEKKLLRKVIDVLGIERIAYLAHLINK